MRALPITVDVTDDGAVTGAVHAATERELGALHGMAAIVGMAGWAPILEMTPEMWDVDHRRNLRYFFVAAREVASEIMRRGEHGSLVCVASIDGIRSAPFPRFVRSSEGRPHQPGEEHVGRMGTTRCPRQRGGTWRHGHAAVS